MSVHKVNPDSTVLNQLDEQWLKIATLLVWKLAKNGVRITHEEMAAFSREDAVLFTHGHKDSIELSIVTAARARALAEYDAKQRGSA